MTVRKPQGIDAETAAALAFQALGFLAGESERLGRFLALTGAAPGDVRGLAATQAFQAAVLDYLLSDESLLLTFAAEMHIEPQRVAAVQAWLSGPAAWSET